jgi:hypothetical protein
MISVMSSASVEKAPVKEWSKTFGGSGYDGGRSVQQTTDGGYIITGGTDSYGAIEDVWLIKTDSRGNKEWSRAFGGLNFDGGNSVQQTNDSGYIITGVTWSYTAGYNDVWLIKTDSKGNMEWSKRFGGQEMDAGLEVQQTTDRGFIIIGSTDSYGAGKGDVWLIKTDLEGNMEWNKTFGGSEYDGGYSGQQTTDEGYILIGTTDSYGAGESDVLLIKTDSNGSAEWSKIFGGAEMDVGHSGQQTTDGGYIIAGWTYSYGAGNSDVWLIKTDSKGNMEWSETFGSLDSDIGLEVQQTTDNGYIIIGRTSSYGAGSDDVWLIKTDSKGNEEWNKTFGGSRLDSGNFVEQTNDGGYIITGGRYPPDDLYGEKDKAVWLIKIGEAAVETPQGPKPEGAIPGFEAIFVIAGLLVVTYFLRRRSDHEPNR